MYRHNSKERCQSFITYHTVTYHILPSHTICYHDIPYTTVNYHILPCHTIYDYKRVNTYIYFLLSDSPTAINNTHLWMVVVIFTQTEPHPHIQKFIVTFVNPRWKNADICEWYMTKRLNVISSIKKKPKILPPLAGVVITIICDFQTKHWQFLNKLHWSPLQKWWISPRSQYARHGRREMEMYLPSFILIGG